MITSPIGIATASRDKTVRLWIETEGEYKLDKNLVRGIPPNVSCIPIVHIHAVSQEICTFEGWSHRLCCATCVRGVRAAAAIAKRRHLVRYSYFWVLPPTTQKAASVFTKYQPTARSKAQSRTCRFPRQYSALVGNSQCQHSTDSGGPCISGQHQHLVLIRSSR